MAAKARDARAILIERIRSSPPRFVRAVGKPCSIEREASVDDALVDHIWLTFEVVPFGRIRAAINTLSRLNRAAGFDPRVRIGIVRSEWSEPPIEGIIDADEFDYEAVEKTNNVFYEAYERPRLEELLITRGKAAVFVEIWGELYARRQLGMHQIHSRRASRAVPHTVHQRDGALKLYYDERPRSAELLLFKFVGQ
jgi:hypothetical protein